MKHEIFNSMKGQLNPSLQTQAELQEALSQPVKRKPVRWQRYVAVAACFALVVAAFPVYGALNPPLHAYAVEVEAATRQELEAGSGLDQGSGIDGTHPVGTREPTGERPIQEEAAAAYEALMARFATDYGKDSYPDWYGGAYIDDWGGLVVCVVGAPVDDKGLYLDIQAMCGGRPVSFQDVTYPLSKLNALQMETVALLEGLNFAPQLWASGVDEEHNRVDVALPFASKKALAGLHKLDPAGDAIAVTVVERREPVFEVPAGSTQYPSIAPAPGGDVDGDPGGYSYDTQPIPITELPGEVTQPAHYDLLPLEDDPDALAIEPVDPGTDLNDLPAETVAPAQSVDIPAFTPGEE